MVADHNPDEFRDERGFWAALCASYEAKGIDLPRLIQSWAKAKRDSLVDWATEKDFDTLCELGCGRFPLAIALWVIEASQHAAKKWRETIGSARRRDQVIRTLRKAADSLEEINETFIEVMLRDANITLDQDIRRLLSMDPTRSNTPGIAAWPKFAPAPHPATVIRTLRLYARALGMFEAISEETQAHSAESLPRYLISAYVKRATGTFHDREVSALIGSALRTTTYYDEPAHRMWRSRNYEQLEKGFSSLADLLICIGVITSQEA